MATTSTNKQPLLIDRPLHEQVLLTNQITGNADYWLTNNACTVLVDCTTSDGALIEDIYAISRHTTAYNVSLFMYNSVTNLRENDVSPSVSIGSANSRESGQFRGLYVPKGQALWVGLAQISTAGQPTIAQAPAVGASGGYY